MQAVVDSSPHEVLKRVRAEHRRVLRDDEAFALARHLGFGIPAFQQLDHPDRLADLDLSAFPGERVVVKLASADVPHRTDVGGVRVVPRDRAAIRAAIEDMQRRLGATARAFTVFEFVPHDDVLGAQLLLGCRWTTDMGPVIAVGPGGVHAEHLARHFGPGGAPRILSATATEPAALAAALDGHPFVQLASGRVRGGAPHVCMERLRDVLVRLTAFAAGPDADGLGEFEVNPAVQVGDALVALDVLATLRPPAAPPAPPRPLDKLARLLEPRSVAVMGVSERQMNPGRVILRNLLREGFPRDALFVVKEGTPDIDGVPCYVSLAALPTPVDLLVVSVAAPLVPGVVAEAVRAEGAESIIVTPGGLGERAGSERLEAEMLEPVHAARSTAWRGPIINGGNCLGLRSVPGRYDTMFIPDYKLPPRRRAASPVALIAQSGALAVAKSSALIGSDPRYVISVGNQSDLTVGDYLTYLADDRELSVFACYVEGFKPGDGRRWLEAARRITASGRLVLAYRAGRTTVGVRATASHTAAVAGDYTVFRALAEQAGVLVAESLAEFEALLQLAARLHDARVAGTRLGAVSNAGFECVAIADSAGGMTLAEFGAGTVRTLDALLRHHRLDAVVQVANPLDVTPIMDDAGYAEAVRAVLDDDGVDVALVGCVPLTGALRTLPAGTGHAEDLDDAVSLASRLAALAAEREKAWVAVVDAGPQYDAFAARLLWAGIPTFRSADRAVRMLDRYCRSRLSAHTIGRQ